MSDLERELESELHRVLDPILGLPIPARRASAPGGYLQRLLGGAGAALTLKVLTGVAAAAAAATVAGAATTGSLNPTVWGQSVSQKVVSCKAALSTGQHGIGDCVSDFANQHGQAVASDARHHGNPNDKTTGQGGGSATGHGNDKGNGNGNGHGNGNGNGNGHGENGPTAPPAKSGGPGGIMKPGPPPGS